MSPIFFPQNLFQQDNASRHTAHIVQEWFEEHDEKFRVFGLQITQISTEHLWDVLEQQVPSTAASPHNLQDLKDLLLMSWCQIPLGTFRGLAESMPRQVRAY